MSENSSNLTSPSLIRRIRSDDSTAWRELVQLYTPLIAHWCRKQRLPPAAVHDCIQEVFFAVLKSLDQFRPSGETGAFRAWLWTITRNKIVDALRKENRHQAAAGGTTALHNLQEIPDQLPTNDPTEELTFHQLLHRVLAQVEAEFEPKTWQAFWRTTIDAIPTHQAAEELEISPAAVRKYRSRILRRLREQMGDEG